MHKVLVFLVWAISADEAATIGGYPMPVAFRAV